MCGIVGYIGNNKAKEILINGLKCLEYRGYDSAGIATIENNKITVMKEKGRVSNFFCWDGCPAAVRAAFARSSFC